MSKNPRKTQAPSPDMVDILTPQGYLSEVMDNPGMDVAMNLFRIPRAFSVSGFGDWSVGQHSFCVAFLALYWAKHRGYSFAERNSLMVMGLTHDLHEAATGDILPGLKTPDLKARLSEIQSRFTASLEIEFPERLEGVLKALDMMAFLYEIRTAAVNNEEQRARLAIFFADQKQRLLEFSQKNKMTGVEAFMEVVGITEIIPQ